MIDSGVVAELRASGVGFICAMCELMHLGKLRGLARCIGSKVCRGPIGGGDFQDYKGPLTREIMSQICFVCGNKAEYRFEPKINVLKKSFGVCKACLEMVEKLGTSFEMEKKT